MPISTKVFTLTHLEVVAFFLLLLLFLFVRESLLQIVGPVHESLVAFSKQGQQFQLVAEIAAFHG